jgi:hypothetical protein
VQANSDGVLLLRSYELGGELEDLKILTPAARTGDGDQRWAPGNQRVQADFPSGKIPAVGQRTHHLDILPSDPDILAGRTT